ncbi:MAG TPA: PQQ-binding-like beta-propeller repeat protein [Chloroflexota bacterium]|jgi:outer membrane protein assembly factor BamB|nr:PQQ-binding-like beta-propeller repeat protein [Chloroflexota bacterium]
MRVPDLRRLVVAGSLALALATPTVSVAVAESWPVFLGNPRHSGLAAVAGPRLLTLAWYNAAGDDIDSSAVIDSDGTVYFSTADGQVRARFPDGGEKWAYSAATRLYASPIIGRDGEVLIGDTRGRFRALNRDDGTIAWTVSGMGSIRATAALGADGTIYVGNEAGELFGLDSRAQGKELFRQRARAGIVSAPAIAPNGDVYWAANDGELRRMTSKGDIIWSKSFDGPIASSPSIGTDGTVYVGSGASILAISPDGEVKWRVGPGAAVATTPTIGPDGTVYAGADNGRFTAASSSGTVRWQVETGATIRSSAAISSNGLVYFGSGDGTVYAYDSAGNRLSTYRALDAVNGSISIGPSGLVFAGSRDNRLYAFRDDVRSFTASPGDRLGGDVVRDPTTGRVFVIADGQRRYIPDPTTQSLLGLVAAVPRNLNSAELARYPEGPALPALSEGSLVRADNGPIYVIRDGKRVWIRSLEEFTTGGYRWEAVVPIDERVLRSLQLSPQDEMLLKGTDDRVYLYSSGQRRWISSGSIFTARGYTWWQVHFVANDALQAIPEGPALS